MLFYLTGRNLQIPNLHINNIKLECLDYFNFLGITIVKHLSWKEHINLISNKLSRTVGVINRLKNYILENVLLTIYRSLRCVKAAWFQLRNIRSVRSSLTKEATLRLVCSLVMPRLDYGNISLYGISKGLLDKL